jgi:hypothetical protein
MEPGVDRVLGLAVAMCDGGAEEPSGTVEIASSRRTSGADRWK